MDAAEVNGLMVNSGEGGAATNDIYADYTLGDDGDQVFDDDFFTKVENYVLNREADLHARFGQAIKDYCNKNNMEFPVHYIMTQEIDRNQISDANLVYSFRFPSDIGINLTGETQSQLNAVLVVSVFIGMSTGGFLGSQGYALFGWPVVTLLASVAAVLAFVVRLMAYKASSV